MATVKSPFITAYGPKNRLQTDFSPISRTKQSFKAECDVNGIMARYIKTGVLDFANRNQPRYADVTGATFQNAMTVIAGARSMFHQLPAAIRDRFKNDPGTFFDYVNNPANKAEAIELGLIQPEQPEQPAPAAQPPAGATAQGGGGTPAPTTP